MHIGARNAAASGAIGALLLACGGGGSSEEVAARATAQALTVGSPCNQGARCTADAPLDPLAPWPKFRGNLRQDGRSSALPVHTALRPWSFRTGKGVFAHPVVGRDGTVYLGSADRTFYALTEEGALRWKAEAGEVIDSGALLDDHGRVYYASGDGKLYARDAGTGALAWTFEAEHPSVNGAYINWFEAGVAIGADGKLLVPNDNFSFYAVGRDDGALAWKWRMNDQTWSLPAVDPSTGNVFLGNNYIAPYRWMGALWRNTFALGPDGRELWGTSVQATVAASPVLTDDGKLVMGGFDGIVRAYDAATGSTAWTFSTDDHIYASPALLPDGTIVQPSADGSVYALAAADGALVWRFDAREPVRSSPAVDGQGNVYFGGGDGCLYVLRSDGSLRFRMKLVEEGRNDLNASVALGRHAVYLAGESGEVFGVPYDWCLRPEGAGDARCATSLPAAPDGAAIAMVTPLGATLAAPRAAIDANEALTFQLTVREGGAPRYALLDERTLAVELDPPAAADTVVSGDQRWLTVVPRSAFAARAGALRLRVRGTYRVDPQRDGLAARGGRTGGTFDRTFVVDVRGGDASAPDLAIPTVAGAPTTVLEMLRLAAPLPTVLPSYNQIGFDSLHYLVTLVEPTAGGAIGWVAGATLDGAGKAIVDPATKAMFPVEMTYDGGLLTMKNEAGFTANSMNIDMPMETFRVSARLAGAPFAEVGEPVVHVTTRCASIPTYGPFLANLGFCNPSTDVLSVFGSLKLRAHDGGLLAAPAGVGAVDFSVKKRWLGGPTVTATLRGTQLRADAHAVGLLLVDVGTGKPISLTYGPSLKRTVAGDGTLATVSIDVPSARLVNTARAYLVVDGYPAARRTVALR